MKGWLLASVLALQVQAGPAPTATPTMSAEDQEIVKRLEFLEQYQMLRGPEFETFVEVSTEETRGVTQPKPAKEKRR